ncbi:MAG: BamA/TamA family outer membrane protein [Pseudomonadota bacterium]
MSLPVFSRWSLPRRIRRRALTLAAGVLLAGRALAGSAEYSSYELEVLAPELERHRAEIEPSPDGKIVSEIHVVTLDVFDESDPVPDFFNVFHATTRERVIRRELLFREGEPYDSRRADETARNLKALRQLSLVLVVPITDPRPGFVRVLVMTKDVWSLRLNSDFQVANGRLNYLLLNPSEENVFGTHASVGALLVLERDTFSVGGLVSHHRILGSRLSGSAFTALVFNRHTGEREGSYGTLSYGLPLYSAEQRWAFGSTVEFRDYLVRLYGRDGRVFLFDADATEENDAIPVVYAYERYYSANEVTRAFGRQRRVLLTFGFEIDHTAYRARVPPGTDPRAEAELVEEEIPRGDTRLGPFVGLRLHEERYLKTIDLETLGLQEDFRLGYDATLRLYPASRALGSSRDLLGVSSGLSYTHALGDGLVRVLAASSIEYANDERHDALATLAARFASPRLGFGRIIADGVFQNRYWNHRNRRFALGGADRLRGYPTDDPALRGDDAAALNVELRTRGIDILSAQCGLAAFYDVGGVANRVSDIALRQSVGVGLRILFPQANRYVFRADYGLPLSPGYPTLPGGVFVTFGQAFGMPTLASPSVTGFAAR